MLNLATPSWANGYARCAAESQYPELWQNLVCAYVPSFGPTGELLFDISSNQKHGSTTAMTAANWTNGGLDFNGSTQYIGNIPAQPAPRRYTYFALIYPTRAEASTDNGNIISYIDDYTAITSWDRGIGVVTEGATTKAIAYQFSSTPKSAYSGASSITLNSWNTIAGKYDGINLYAYGNGVPGAATAAGIPYIYTTAKIAIARTGGLGADSFYQGNIKLILHWSEALHDSQILFLHGDPYAMFRLG